jgi:Leucine-rich repeat (LRR) protein
MALPSLQFISLEQNHLCTEEQDLIEFLDANAPEWRDQKLDTECEPVRRILMELYEATDGPNWTHNDNWGTDADVGTWYGVMAHPEGMFELNLYNNNLNGPLPASMAELTRLRWLDLSGNNLTGSLPDNIGNLTNLDQLYLTGNQLSGPIPDSIGELTQLINLDLVDNELTGLIPTTIMNLTNTNIMLFANHLCAEDPVLIEFLDMHAPNWREGQTETICD